MGSNGNQSITSFFQPSGEAKGKSKAASDTTKMEGAETLTKTEPKPQTKGKGKRASSASPPAPAMKRSNIVNTSDRPTRHLAYNDLPSEWLQHLPKASANADAHSIQLTYHKGDIFAAPPNCLLIHACNTQGHWGAGIAKAFKALYPKAYLAHNKFCAEEHNPKINAVPTGSAQILSPVDAGIGHWIGCVFTSAKYGRAKDKPAMIVENTAASMKMLLELVKVAGDEGDSVSEIRMCKINSGKFGVPWEKTEEALKSIVLQEGWPTKIEVWEPIDD